MNFEHMVQQVSFGLSEMAVSCDNDIISNCLAELADKVVTFNTPRDLKTLTRGDKALIEWYYLNKDKKKESYHYTVTIHKLPEEFSAKVKLYSSKGWESFIIQGVSEYSLGMRILKNLRVNYPGTYEFPDDEHIHFGKMKRDQAKMIRRVESLE